MRTGRAGPVGPVAEKDAGLDMAKPSAPTGACGQAALLEFEWVNSMIRQVLFLLLSLSRCGRRAAGRLPCGVHAGGETAAADWQLTGGEAREIARGLCLMHRTKGHATKVKTKGRAKNSGDVCPPSYHLCQSPFSVAGGIAALSFTSPLHASCADHEEIIKTFSSPNCNSSLS